MTCIVLVRNPHGGGILPLTAGEDGDEIAQWPSQEAARAAAADHHLVQAWGGHIVDLDNQEVTLI